MATSQITADARLRAFRDAYERNAEGVVVVKEGENFDTILNRALGLVNLKSEDITESQRNNFRNSFTAVRSEVYASSTVVKNDEGEEVKAIEFLTSKKVKKPDMLKKLQTTYKDRIVIEGKLLPIPNGFAKNGQKGRRAVAAMSYFDQI